MMPLFAIFCLITTPDDAAHRDALARYGAGLLHSKRDELLSAKSQFELAVKQDPTAAEPLRSLFRLYLDLGKYTAAKRTGHKILELDGEDYKTALILGRVYFDGNQPREAIDVYSKATQSARLAKKDPSTAIDLYSALATAQEKSGDTASAEQSLVTMTELYRDRSKEIRRQNNWTSAEHARMAGLALERLGLLRVAAKKPVEAGEAFFQAEKLFAGPAQHPIGAARLKRNLARAFAATGETTKAVEAFRQFLKVDPPGIEPYVEYLNLLHSDGKTDDAITELTEFIRRKPLEKGLLWLQLAAKVKAGKIDGADAIERFEKLAANSADPALWKVAAECFSVENLVQWFDSASNRAHPDDRGLTKPDPVAASIVRGLSDAIREYPSISREFVDLVVSGTRNGIVRSYGTYEFTAWLGERIGARKQAEMALISAARQANGNWDRMRPLMAHYERQRKWDKVVEECTPFMQERNGTVQAIYTAAYAEAERGNSREALKLVDRLIRDDRLFAEGKLTVKMQQCRVLISAGDPQRALTITESLFDDAANPAEIRRLRVILADAYFALRKVDEAEAQLRAILEEDPDDALALNNLGYNLADRSLKLAEAEALCRRAVEQDRDDRRRSGDPVPESGTYLDSLGWCLFRRGKLAEAKAVFETAVSLPDASADPTVWDHLGDVCFKLGDQAGARTAWNNASKGYPDTATGRQGGRLAEVKKKLSLLQ